MQSVRCLLSLSLALLAPAGFAQEDRPDVQVDGLLGAVKSVSTIITRSNVEWQQPDGPALMFPINCADCEYDPDGSRTRSADVVAGEVKGGQATLLERDANGRVNARHVIDISTNEVIRDEVVGPFGKTSETDYLHGKVLYQQSYSYDQYGHMNDALTLDHAGQQLSRTQTTTTKDGLMTETAAWGKEGELTWRQTFDPETKLEHFTSFDDSGNVKLTWTFQRGKVASFWEQSDSLREFGDSFIDTSDNGDLVDYRCRKSQSCERSTVHYEYLSPGKRNPKSAEWRDAEGHLLYAAYYDYDLDSSQNWTHRRVSVWSSASGERSLYEEDSRILTYWQK